MNIQMKKVPFQIPLNQSLEHHENRTAIQHGDEKVSYAQLREKAGAVARWIVHSRIEEGSFIGLCLENRVDLIAAIIGILNARCVFVILDASLPDKRLQSMMTITGLGFLLTDEINRERLETGGIVNAVTGESFYRDFAEGEDGLRANWDREDEIYVFFTSGSTGLPKAILGKNKSLLHYIHWEIETFEVNEDIRFSQLVTPGFDAFLRDVFAPLLSGGAICLPEPREIVMDGRRLAAWLDKNDIGLVHCVPSVFRLFAAASIDPAAFSALKYILLSGEPVPPRLVKQWYSVFGERIRLVNLYGLTEVTMTRTWYFITPGDGDKARVPAGMPMRGTRILVLDEQLKLCAREQVGEIYIRTPFGGHGYYNDPAANKEKFIVNPFTGDPNDLLFRSGDLGRVLNDGNLEVLGRIDRQVKIRGVRVEPEEIELYLTRRPDVQNAAVTDRRDRDGEVYLCAYVVSNEPLSAGQLATYLERRVPDFMIPRYFVSMESLPLTASGKVDRKELPEPRMNVSQDYTAPENEVQASLVSIWSEVLGVDKEIIGIDDNFFRLGGHSLKATYMVEQVHKHLNVKVSLADAFQHRSIRSLAQFMEGLSEDRFQAIEPVEERDYYPLSSAQKRMYILQQVDLESTVYNMTQFFPLPGEPDVEKLEHCFSMLIQRHESLRTSFEWVDDQPVQRVHDAVEFKLEVSRSAGLGVKPFDLCRPPLLRVVLSRMPDEQYLLVVDMHHIISDGVSLHLLGRDVMNLYAGETLEPLSIRYKDYSAWQNSEKERQNIRSQEVFWQEQLSGEIPILDIPIDYPRPEVQDFAGSSLSFVIGAQETARLKQIALDGNATLYMVLLAVYNLFLAKLCGQREIIVGAPIAGRRHADLERVIGMFVNTLAMRNYPSQNLTFAQFLENLKHRAIGAFENQDYPFEDLVEIAAVKRDAGRNPLFDVVYILQNMGDIPVEASVTPWDGDEELEDQVRQGYHRTAKFDLTLMLAEQPGSMTAMFQYSTRLFKPETIRRFIAYFKHVITEVTDDPGIMLAHVELIPEEEKQRILTQFNRVETAYPRDKTIHQLFQQQARRTPDAAALCGFHGTNGTEGTFWTYVSYKQLNEDAAILADALRRQGAGPGVIIALKMERSLEMMVSILAILKSGSAYLPIETGFPRERIDYMLNDSAASLLLDEKGIHSLAGGIVAGASAGASDLAYVIYTSGSTGKPKGVLTMHYNVTRVVRDTDYIQLDEKDRVLQLSNYAFDGSVFDIFAAFLNGGLLVLAPRGHGADVQRLSQLIRREAVTVFFVTTALFNLIVDEAPEILLSIGKVLFGGERVSVSHARRALDIAGPGKIVHMYGPTETTVYAAFHPIDSIEENAITIPIGGPLANTSIFILDDLLNPVPIGISGEIYIGGPGLARGYLNRPGLTAQNFITKSFAGVQGAVFQKSPLAAGGIYKTGDLGRWLPGGSIQFLGRVDFQVKVRGFRIELGEIENELFKREDIKEAVVEVFAIDGGDKFLCAYIVPTEAGPPVQELKLYLSRTLPEYMIPSFFVFLEGLPLTANGKLDRSLLPRPEAGEDRERYIAPRSRTEKEMAGIWSEILGVELSRIGIDTDFFQLGGHSLKATVMISRVHRVLNVRLPLAEVFRTPSIRELSCFIDESARNPYASIQPVEKRQYYELSPAQFRLYVQHTAGTLGIAYNMPQLIPLPGEGLDMGRLEQVFLALIQRHESLRTSFITVGNETFQRVHDHVEFKIRRSDISGPGGEEELKRKISSIMSEFVRPFDLGTAPLARARFLYTGLAQNFLLVDIHHIITDGVSGDVLARDFQILFSGGEPPRLRLQYKDFAYWQNRRGRDGSLEKQRQYWLDRFKTPLPPLDLAADFPRTPGMSSQGVRVSFELDTASLTRIGTFVKENKSTLFTFLLSAYFILLSRYSLKEDIVAGITVSGRRHADLQNIMGMFVNMLAIRCAPQSNKTFRAFFLEVKQSVLDAMENQDYQFDRLVMDLGLHQQRESGGNPLVDAVFSFFSVDDPGQRPAGQSHSQSGGQSGEETGISSGHEAKFDLSLGASERANRVRFYFDYRKALFKEETILDMSRHYTAILAQASLNPGLKLPEIGLSGASGEAVEINRETGSIADDVDFDF